MPTFAPAGLYGKIPSHGDFVRLRAADEPARSLVRWLEEGSEAAKRGGAGASGEPVRFVFRPPGAALSLLGVVAGSVDRVGRSFPLAVFAPVGGSELTATFPALASAAQPFLEASAALMAEAAHLAPSDLAARVEALPCLEPADLAVADADARRGASRESGRELLARLLGDSGDQQAYALQCVRSACQPLRGREGGGRGVVLACPARCGADRWFWLELARRLLRWPGPPSFFWRAAMAPELFLSTGALSPSMFADLWRAEAKDPRIWPLTTTQASAATAARRALGEAVLDVLQGRDRSVADLLDALDARTE